jgi:hypothetical protein
MIATTALSEWPMVESLSVLGNIPPEVQANVVVKLVDDQRADYLMWNA